MIRLFIAIPLPAPIESHLLSLADSIKGKGIRPVHAAHLTLKFLGWVKEDTVDEIMQRLAVSKAISLSLDGVGFFPDERKMRVVWAGVEPQQPVIELQQQVDALLAGIFPKEERFVPHLTLARIAVNDTNQAKRIKDVSIEKKTFRVDRIVLYKSTLHPSGPVYEEVICVRSRVE
ncbi:RNA 2',3'-cyclic phosphodiesterase [Candidatus Woesearchaeota archaeon]|nr:RNA 2',3'-cyclic phosphodiesterase [Candidatus Woesearchaeota archaeon]